MANSAGRGDRDKRRLVPIQLCWRLWFCACGLATLTLAKATPPPCVSSPVGFFTNVASRLLASELNVNFTRIQIYPTNQYTPAVHRLLQVAANVYDATSTNFYPSVFRPVFTNDGTNVFITGYEQVESVSNTSDPQLALPVDVVNVPVGLSTNLNVYGIPWIISAKKGFPNFNEFSMENIVSVSRKLEITRPSINTPPSDYQTNQMYILSVSNSLGVECWNSYSNSYVSPQIQIAVRDGLSVALTNEEVDGIAMAPVVLFDNLMSNTVNLPVWPGTVPWVQVSLNRESPNVASFDIPLNVSTTLLPNSIYVFSTHSFIPATVGTLSDYLDAGIVPLPQFGLLITNRLQVVMLDGSHVIDYVEFAGPETGWNLNATIADVAPNNPNSGLWNTNLFQNSLTPLGVMNQILYSLDPRYGTSYLTLNDNGTWNAPPNGGTIGQEIAYFDAFFSLSHFAAATDPYTGYIYYATNLDLNVQVPFTPSRIVYQYISWQANDPLVHYLASDLDFTGTEPGGLQTGMHQWNNAWGTNVPPTNLGKLNDRYAPWGWSYPVPAGVFADTNADNLAYKDPLVRSSDDWDFPTNGPSFVNYLGRIHRGTPWQTIYLKSATVDLPTWGNWTGDTNDADARLTEPTNDWQTASLLVSLLNAKDLCSLLSVNNPNSNAWLAVFDGLIALTNSVPDNLLFAGSVPQFDSLTILSNSPQALVLANAIQFARFSQPGQFFHEVGDILAVPQLTEQSPFLNWNDSPQQRYGISDEAYEKIPAQLLPLLRADSVGSVVPVSGQADVQFTGCDGHAYAIEVSSDLKNWTSISTNYPVNGTFSLTNLTPANPNQQFYRSVLLQ